MMSHYSTPRMTFSSNKLKGPLSGAFRVKKLIWSVQNDATQSITRFHSNTQLYYAPVTLILAEEAYVPFQEAATQGLSLDDCYIKFYTKVNGKLQEAVVFTFADTLPRFVAEINEKAYAKLEKDKILEAVKRDADKTNLVSLHYYISELKKHEAFNYGSPSNMARYVVVSAAYSSVKIACSVFDLKGAKAGHTAYSLKLDEHFS